MNLIFWVALIAAISTWAALDVAAEYGKTKIAWLSAGSPPSPPTPRETPETTGTRLR
jgi:hypothetical protein